MYDDALSLSLYIVVNIVVDSCMLWQLVVMHMLKLILF